MFLKGKNALVTGASGALGGAIARALAKEGAVVGLHYRSNQARAEALAQEIATDGGRVTPVHGDLAAPDGPAAIAAATEKRIGPIHILVNNGGSWVEKPLLETSAVEWDSLLNTDLRGTFLLTRAIAPGMVGQGWGRIVNISSIASLNYIANEGAYGVAKAAINMLTKAFAAELGPHRITVNAIAPGWTVATEDYPPRPEEYQQCRQTPDRRPGHALEIAAGILFLASEKAAHVNGQILCFDGGQSVLTPKGR